MKNSFSRMAKASLVALAMVTGGSSLSFAAPYGAFVNAPASVTPVDSAATPQLVRDRRGGRERWHRGGYGRHDGWRGGHRGWRNGYRSHYGRDRDYYGSAAVLGLGLGLLAAPRYYAPDYEYVQPRRVYRSVGNTHVQWCYNRYRSYRPSDNSFQPYNGPRQQCYSPYS